MKKLALLPAIVMLLAVWLSARPLKADIVVVNANIHTMDTARPLARSLAVLGGKIVRVGSDADTKPLIGPATRVIDAGGKTVIPGFNDAHLHFISGGMQLGLIDLRDARSREEFAARIKEYSAKLKPGEWILGGNWDHENWTPNDLPTRQLIDAAAPNNPVFVERLDGHMGVANSLALKLAGVTKETKDVDGGLIVRDANGEPTGVLKDTAMGIVDRIIPPSSTAQLTAAAIAATDHAASLGVTSVQDMSAGKAVSIYQELIRAGRLKTRIYAGNALFDRQGLEDVGLQSAFGSPMLRVGSLKGFADGSLGSRTAWFFEPYNDDPSTSGIPRAEVLTTMKAAVADADKHGLQVMIHAIGDRSNATILDIYESVIREDGPRDRRFRIEHSQHLRPQDIPRFAKLGVVASMQPVHLTDDGRWAVDRLGSERLKGAYAFRSLLDSGAHLAFGTDWSVAPLNPLFGIQAAVTRRTTDGKNPNGWFPEQKITVDDAVRCYTLGSAYAEFQEDVKGTLSEGKLADLIVLSDDIFTINPAKIGEAKVLMTVVDGRVVYEAKK
ncbi:MAG: amidohydrolase [Chloracidobacterium sp.]|nr:amidohydrolase [Chloracidobacterium sp.]MCO5333759.1 amidohydrolase [Pyrinomonadaceae bacterium]